MKKKKSKPIKLPTCLIYFTDLEGTFPKEEPDYPVLWINIGRTIIKPPFGECYNSRGGQL